MRLLRKRIRDLLYQRPASGLSKRIIDGYRMYRSARYGALQNVSEILISHQAQVVFATNPKCASRSIISWFQSRYPDAQILEYTAITALWEKYGDSYKFYTVLRAPVDRVVSCFNEKVGTENEYRFQLNFGSKAGIAVDASFDDFVAWLGSHPHAKDEVIDRHLVSQHWLLRPDVVQYTQAFSLRDVWTQMGEAGLLAPGFEAPERLNVSTRKIQASEVSPALRAQIEQRYAKDVAWLNTLDTAASAEHPSSTRASTA